MYLKISWKIGVLPHRTIAISLKKRNSQRIQVVAKVCMFSFHTHTHTHTHTNVTGLKYSLELLTFVTQNFCSHSRRRLQMGIIQKPDSRPVAPEVWRRVSPLMGHGPLTLLAFPLHLPIDSREQNQYFTSAETILKGAWEIPVKIWYFIKSEMYLCVRVFKNKGTVCLLSLKSN